MPAVDYERAQSNREGPQGPLPPDSEPKSDHRRRGAGGPSRDRRLAERTRARRRCNERVAAQLDCLRGAPDLPAGDGREPSATCPIWSARSKPSSSRTACPRADHDPHERLPQRLLAAVRRRNRADRTRTRQVQSLPRRRLPRRAAEPGLCREHRRGPQSSRSSPRSLPRLPRIASPANASAISSRAWLTRPQRRSMLMAMIQVRSATTWWWRWSPAMDAARAANG